MRLKRQFFFLAIILSTTFTALSGLSQTTPSNDELKLVGLKIWKNECAGTKEGLTSWNKGEEFASLGIGHFIWYPPSYRGSFDEQFPQLLAFLMEHKVNLPEWLKACNGCPWKCREDFLQDFNGKQLAELRALLYATVDLQIAFMKSRLEKALPKMTKELSPSQRKKITAQFQHVLNSKNGLYVLLDYTNFKGEGTSPMERYRNQGWGLLQVLERMPLEAKNSISDFVTCAKELLALRVENAPPERNEQRWLKGWFNRLDSYLSP